MDMDDSYLPLSLVANDDKLSFVDKENRLMNQHQLSKVHMNTADCRETKCVDKTGKRAAAKLTLDNGIHAKVYFMSFEMMQRALEKVVTMQGFADRLDQYEHVTNLSQGVNCTRSLVQHKYTGMQFVLKRCTDANG